MNCGKGLVEGSNQTLLNYRSVISYLVAEYPVIYFLAGSIMKGLFFPAVVALVFAGCIHYGANPNAAYNLSKARLRVTEREALEGDNDAAKRMANYYYFIKNDRASSIWWNKLAAIRGDSVAKLNLRQLEQE